MLTSTYAENFAGHGYTKTRIKKCKKFLSVTVYSFASSHFCPSLTSSASIVCLVTVFSLSEKWHKFLTCRLNLEIIMQTKNI
jgi:hypothetical protein